VTACARRGGDHLAVILEESQPALAGVTAVPHSSQVPRHGSFGNLEAELLQLSVELGSASIEVLIRLASDQNTNLIADPRPAAARSRSPPPREPKPSAMPTDNGFRFDNYQHLGPLGPEEAQGRPGQPIQLTQLRTRPLPLEYRDLLPQGEDLKCSVMPTAEEDSDSGQESNGEFEHEPYVLT
jgi:hypothetical protein